MANTFDTFFKIILSIASIALTAVLGWLTYTTQWDSVVQRHSATCLLYVTGSSGRPALREDNNALSEEIVELVQLACDFPDDRKEALAIALQGISADFNQESSVIAVENGSSSPTIEQLNGAVAIGKVTPTALVDVNFEYPSGGPAIDVEGSPPTAGTTLKARWSVNLRENMRITTGG